jgi:hypothetical protein
MKKMLRSSVVLMLAAAVGLMLNVGCEDSELSRLLGLSKKKNDYSSQQPQETSSQSAVENAEETTTEDSENLEAKESESKESDSQDGTQTSNSTQNGEENNSQNGTQSGNDNSNQNGEGTSDVQNGNDSSSQSSSLPQTQSDGNTDGQTNNNGSPQNQISENVGGIQPLDIVMLSGKNYIKVLQLSGNRNPNDLGYTGTWEYFDPTPVGTERTIYGTTKPNDLGEVGTWTFAGSLVVLREYTNAAANTAVQPNELYVIDYILSSVTIVNNYVYFKFQRITTKEITNNRTLFTFNIPDMISKTLDLLMKLEAGLLWILTKSESCQ